MDKDLVNYDCGGHWREYIYITGMAESGEEETQV